MAQPKIESFKNIQANFTVEVYEIEKGAAAYQFGHHVVSALVARHENWRPAIVLVTDVDACPRLQQKSNHVDVSAADSAL